MGFWDVTKRVIQGKPGFEAPKPGDEWDDDKPTIDFSEERKAKLAHKGQQTDLHDAAGYKQIPVASLTDVNGVQSGSKVELWITIENQSTRELCLDKIVLLGTTFEIDIPLAANQSRELRAYRGNQMTHDHYKKASLYYKDVLSGDYFRADHLIHYKYDGDKTYDVNGFELLTPINDI